MARSVLATQGTGASPSFLKDRLYSKEKSSEFDPLVIALGWLLSDLLDRSSPLPALVGSLTLATWMNPYLQPHFEAFGRLSVRVANGIEREVTCGRRIECD